MRFAIIALPVLAGAVQPAMAGDGAAGYTKMAPVEQYLMADRNAEMALARTAAAASISRDAEVRVPMYVNGPGAHSYLLRIVKETGWILDGQTKDELNRTVAAAIGKQELPAMEPGAMCYTMSKEGYAGDGTRHWPPHLMFFYSRTSPAIWGANLPDSPVIAVADPLEQMTQFVIAVQRWSDGTEYLPR